MEHASTNAEQLRLDAAHERGVPWKKWGPYLSERQWGTVREDYSSDGNAWDYFPHDQARSRAYRWGEDGLAGYSDERQRLCFGIALWNGKDPIIKERLFGLTNSEGNHGEDVKEYYFYLDSTPTHSYMKYLYKYPQAAYPYSDLVETNRRRSRTELEYELLNTGVFNDGRYFDVFVEYAKETSEDTLITITVANRGPEAAHLHLLPTLWFRNTWSWWPGTPKPTLYKTDGVEGASIVAAAHYQLGDVYLYCEGSPPLLFTENETNSQRCFGRPNPTPYVKDGINNFLVQSDAAAVNPNQTGTKVAAHYSLVVGPGQSKVVRLRLTNVSPSSLGEAYTAAEGNPFGQYFEDMWALRKQEADRFFDLITPDSMDADSAMVMRQALAGMLWSKQYYFFDLDHWLEEHEAHPGAGSKRKRIRNAEWFHMLNDDIISMPDKWEYPWYAAWDLAFHTVALAMVDLDFAKQQLQLMLREMYLHPNGQIPAYEWNFGDVNPPVHAWATMSVYQVEKDRTGKGDIDFLRRSFQKLLLNFTWWVNRKDPSGKNVFEGGFLGLDNIGVFDRSAPLPTGGNLEQADGTAWMVFFCLGMLDMAMELAEHDPLYDDLAYKFIEHFFWIASAMDRVGDLQDEMWDQKDGFFYDLLRLPDGTAVRLKVRSLVGLLPLCAASVFSPGLQSKFPSLMERARRFLSRYPDVGANICPPGIKGVQGRTMLAIFDDDKLRRVLKCMLDENEFFGPHGVRSVSKFHEANPYVFRVKDEEYRVHYVPAESNTGMFGGNSNWRGPVWMPINALIIRGLLQYYLFYGDDFRVECPTRSGNMMTLFEVARELSDRLASTFTRGKDGRRPVFGGAEMFQNDPHWRDCLLFYEYFHGDNGAGVGASHQTGWTGVIARFMQIFSYVKPAEMLTGAANRPLTKFYEDSK